MNSMRWPFLWALAIWVALVVVVACSKGDDDDEKAHPVWTDECWYRMPSEDDDSGAEFEMKFGCGDWDDDVNDESDDDADDDTHWGNSPVISHGMWTPDIATDNGAGEFFSNLSGAVCDVDNDLEGGQIYIWVTGQYAPLLAYNIFWADMGPEMSDVADCDAPVSFDVPVDFTEIVPYDDDVCVDLEVSDGAGNLSNKLTNICVFVP